MIFIHCVIQSCDFSASTYRLATHVGIFCNGQRQQPYQEDVELEEKNRATSSSFKNIQNLVFQITNRDTIIGLLLSKYHLSLSNSEVSKITLEVLVVNSSLEMSVSLFQLQNVTDSKHINFKWSNQVFSRISCWHRVAFIVVRSITERKKRKCAILESRLGRTWIKFWLPFKMFYYPSTCSIWFFGGIIYRVPRSRKVWIKNLF